MTFRALSVLALLVGSAALADDSPEMTVRYRHVVMESVGDHMKASGLIVKGEVGRVEDIKMHAAAMHEASMMFDQLFPKGTGPDAVPKTEALPKIWEDWDGFVAANKKFQTKSEELMKAAETGDMEKIRPAFGALGKSCGGCHDDFRKDDD